MNKLIWISELIRHGKLPDYVRSKCECFALRSNLYAMQRSEKKLVAMMRYACAHCDYYRLLGLNPCTADDLKAFPFLTKDLIRDNYKALTSDEQNHMIYRLDHTGGSTGQPLEFLGQSNHDPIFQNRLWVSNGYRAGDIILAMDGAKIPEHSENPAQVWYYKSDSQLPYGGFGLSSLYLTKENVDLYVAFIMALKPSFIRGYPAFIYSIAQYILKAGIDLGCNIKAVELTSESSFQFQYDAIEEAFQTKVILQYGHTEQCAFAYSFDSTYRYRVEPLYGYVEVIKKDGSHAKIGEKGEIVVTTFYNRIMPLIRYKTGDEAVYGGKDEEGIILDRILGRTQDYIINNNGDKVLLTALIFAQHFDAMRDVRAWQIEQFEPGKIIITIVQDDSYEDEAEREIVELFETLGGVTVQLQYAEQLHRTPRGKSLLLVQHLDLDHFSG